MFWLVLMGAFGNAFKWTHIYGSLFTIGCRLPFVVAPALMFDHAHQRTVT